MEDKILNPSQDCLDTCPSKATPERFLLCIGPIPLKLRAKMEVKHVPPCSI